MLRYQKITSFIGIFFAITFGFWNLQPAFALASTATLSATSAATPTTTLGAVRPVEIDIPAIKAQIPIISVGVTATNNLDVPHNFVQAGWYDQGPVPGAPGTAVIDGHVDNGGKKPTVAGVFKNLNKVTPGSVINVTASDGSVAQFKVTAANLYSYSKFPSSEVFAQTDQSMLNIITCAGTWLPSADTYSQRLVVTAEKIS
jgi:sortase (surface protein transpeptidase)